MQITKHLFIGVAAAALLSACSAGGDNPGREYAPNMYHSVAYEPYSQIMDKDAGQWLTSIEYSNEDGNGGHGEYFNTLWYNPSKSNLRMPPANTVSRNKNGFLPYRIPKDSIQTAAAKLVSPYSADDQTILADGKVLYEVYCDHCHGVKGEGNGKVAEGVVVDGVQRTGYAGVANLKGDAFKNIPEGHVFHVITMGKGLMQSHASQITPDERWKIARYVNSLTK